jgi:hypothetical protein
MNDKISWLYKSVLFSCFFVLIILLTIATPMSLAISDFSIYNTGWNGCSKIIIDGYQAGKFIHTISLNESDFSPIQNSFINYNLDNSNSTIIIIGPQINFSEEESRYIKNFLMEGGTLFIADDFGTSNNLLSKINASSRFSRKLLLDLSFEKNASFVAIFDFNTHSHQIVRNISSLLLNYPSSIDTTKESTILLRSSKLSWLDNNLNGKEDFYELKGPFPILVIEEYGKGEIILLSGPSLLINSMVNKLDNEQFIYHLFNYLYDNKKSIIIDEYHRDSFLPYQLIYELPISLEPIFKFSIIILLFLIFVFLFTSISDDINKKIIQFISKNKKSIKFVEIDTIIDKVLEKHPKWSRYKLENIVKRL